MLASPTAAMRLRAFLPTKRIPNPTHAVINEAGLYRLVFASRKEQAEAVKRWVFPGVMPSFCKTRRYLFTTAVLPAENPLSYRPAYPSSTAQTVGSDSFDPARPEGAIVRTINGWPLAAGQEGEEPRIPATSKRLGHSRR